MSNLEIYEKQTATFETEVSKANQVATWFQNGDEIKPGTPEWERFVPSVDGNVHRLVISNAHLDDTRKYTIKIKDKKNSAKLKVLGKNCSLSFSYLYLINNILGICLITSYL